MSDLTMDDKPSGTSVLAVNPIFELKPQHHDNCFCGERRWTGGGDSMYASQFEFPFIVGGTNEWGDLEWDPTIEF